MPPEDRPVFRLTRRHALAGSAALLSAAALPGCGAYAGGPLDIDVDDVTVDALASSADVDDDALASSEQFGLGVASGLTLSGGVLAWSRYEGGRPLQLVVREEATGLAVAGVTLEPPTASNGTFIRAMLPELSPSTSYQFVFVELDQEGAPLARSPRGSFKTPPAADAAPIVTLGATGCTEFGVPFDVVAAAAQAETDAFILLGDTVYSDDAEGLRGLRGLWHDTLATEAYRELRARRPVLALWDDHEFANNFDPETLDPDRLRQAKQTFFEHQPLERKAQAPEQLWRSHRFGRTVEVFLLDTRSERRPSTIGTTDEILSEEQMEWLTTSLRSSECVFKLIVTGVPIGDVPVPEGETRWPGFAKQREQLLRFVEEEPIEGAFFLAGDIHMCWVGQASSTGPGANLIEIGAGCGAKEIKNPLSTLFVPPTYSYRAAVNNYATLRFDPERREVEVVHRTESMELNRTTLTF